MVNRKPLRKQVKRRLNLTSQTFGRVLDVKVEPIGHLALRKHQGNVRGCVLNKNHMAVGRADSLIKAVASVVRGT